MIKRWDLTFILIIMSHDIHWYTQRAMDWLTIFFQKIKKEGQTGQFFKFEDVATKLQDHKLHTGKLWVGEGVAAGRVSRWRKYLENFYKILQCWRGHWSTGSQGDHRRQPGNWLRRYRSCNFPLRYFPGLSRKVLSSLFYQRYWLIFFLQKVVTECGRG